MFVLGQNIKKSNPWPNLECVAIHSAHPRKLREAKCFAVLDVETQIIVPGHARSLIGQSIRNAVVWCLRFFKIIFTPFVRTHPEPQALLLVPWLSENRDRDMLLTALIEGSYEQ